ncbi:MAG: hypothetical protein QW165_01485 [Candidatus Woesearchaeota archaeon]
MAKLNPVYNDAVVAQAAAHLKKKGSVQLTEILVPGALRVFENLKWKRAYYPDKFSLHYSHPPVVWKEFQKLVSKLIGKKVHCSMQCIALMPGDYSLLYDALRHGKGFIFMFDVNTVPESCGGYTVFLKGNEEVVRVVPKSNTFTIINQSGLKSFHKYVNHHAKNPRIFLCGVALAK